MLDTYVHPRTNIDFRGGNLIAWIEDEYFLPRMLLTLQSLRAEARKRFSAACIRHILPDTTSPVLPAITDS